MDGSMIRPMIVNGVFRLGTKMGVTDTSIAAEAIYTGEQRSWMDLAMKQHVTPLFEFVSPDNRIVLKYDKPELVLLAIRNNITGEYLDIEGLRGNEFFPVVPSYGSLDGNFDEYIARQRGKEGREGDIIRFDDGHMLKIKNDWYVRIHKVKDKIRTDRHVLALLLANDLDDVYPHLDEIDYNYVKGFEAKFHGAMIDKVTHLNAVVSKALADASGDKKKLAIEILPATDLLKHEYGIAFKMADGGHDLGDLVMKHVFASLGNTAKYDDLATWLGINDGEDK
jgi:T4 RnlA family RNA ligase